MCRVRTAGAGAISSAKSARGWTSVSRAEAGGIQTVHAVEQSEKFRFSSEVSQGCEKWLDVERHPSFAAARGRLVAAGFALYAAVPDAAASLDDLDFGRPAAIVVGNEHAGLTDMARAGADIRGRAGE